MVKLENMTKEEPKQETLEEVANRLFYTVGNEGISSIESFINGAKWQQEQDKNKYSEEELKSYGEFCVSTFLGIESVTLSDVYLEQFKKK